LIQEGKMRNLIILITVVMLGLSGNSRESGAAPGGGGGSGRVDLTTNIQVVDSASSPVVIGEVVGVNPGVGLYVALAPSLANADPPLIVVVLGSGATLRGTDILTIQTQLARQPLTLLFQQVSTHRQV
jgi:hypothetical protein